jgi:hypothetical protein
MALTANLERAPCHLGQTELQCTTLLTRATAEPLQVPHLLFVGGNSVGLYTSGCVRGLSERNLHFSCFNVSWKGGKIYSALKNGVFWDVTPCGSCKNRRF